MNNIRFFEPRRHWGTGENIKNSVTQCLRGEGFKAFARGPFYYVLVWTMRFGLFLDVKFP
jgi:hypothetical protein